MALPLVRFRRQNQIHWGTLLGHQVFTIDLPCNTTADLLRLGLHAIRKAADVATDAVDQPA